MMVKYKANAKFSEIYVSVKKEDIWIKLWKVWEHVLKIDWHVSHEARLLYNIKNFLKSHWFSVFLC